MVLAEMRMICFGKREALGRHDRKDVNDEAKHDDETPGVRGVCDCDWRSASTFRGEDDGIDDWLVWSVDKIKPSGPSEAKMLRACRAEHRRFPGGVDWTGEWAHVARTVLLFWKKQNGGTMGKIKRTEILKIKARVFAKHVLSLAQYLRKKKEAILSAQFLRSGTSVGANLAEGRYTFTRGNYISKHSIALAEAGETLYWIELFIDGGFITPNSEFANIHAECSEIIEILEKVVRYARHRKAKEERDAETAHSKRRRQMFDAENENASAMP